MNIFLSKELFDAEVDKIKQSQERPIAAHAAIIRFCSDLLDEYRSHIRLREFKKVDIEVKFFKEEKQIPLTCLILHSQLQEYELHFPRIDRDRQRKFISSQVDRVHSLLQSNIDFVRYLELGQTYLDEVYFTRKYLKEESSEIPFYYRDTAFSTSHDLLLGQIRANELYLHFLGEKLNQLDYPEGRISKESKLKWTSSKVALTELVYALYHSGAVNNGEITLKELVKNIEYFMGIELGDYHHNFLRLRERSNPVKFLDRLKNRLQERMQELDN